LVTQPGNALVAEIGALGAKVDQLAGQDAEQAAERRAEMDQAGIDEPVVHEHDFGEEPGCRHRYLGC
jgi:hypothetical protein